MADIQAGTTGVVTVAAVSEDGFLDERKKFWSFFTGLVTKVLIALVVLLLGMAFFLL